MKFRKMFFAVPIAIVLIGAAIAYAAYWDVRGTNYLVRGVVDLVEQTTVGTPGADVARLHAAVDGVTTKVYYTDQTGTTRGFADGENLEDDSIDDDAIDWSDVTCQDMTMDDCAYVGFGSGEAKLYSATVAVSNAEIKALNGTPKTLVAAPGAGYFIEFVSAVLILDYGSEALTETDDNLVIEYATGGGDVTASIECTGFIDATADQMALVVAATLPTDAAADIVNNALQLYNPNDEFAGNASADTTLSVRVNYYVHASGL